MDTITVMGWRLQGLSRALVLAGFMTLGVLTSSVLAVTPQVAVGSGHTVALKSDGTLWAWGRNDSGQLGDGTTLARSTPAQVPGLFGITAVAAGNGYTLALRDDGTLWAWGDGQFNGMLEDGTLTRRHAPVPVPDLSGITAIAVGGHHTLALKRDGTLWAWGRNDSGQLGDETTIFERYTPAQVPGLSGIIAIAAGRAHTLALKSDGTLWAWGDNRFGQLGDGTTIGRSTPVPVPGLSGIIAIAAGGNHTLVLKSDGTLWAWGDNWYGQLGDGTATNRLTPVPVPDLSGITALTAGSMYTLALKSDGTLWAWGYNGDGELGDGTATNRLTPVPVPDLSGITALAAGTAHTVALKSDGTLWAWGDNDHGQLGDGTTRWRSTPEPVPDLSGITAIAAGYSYTLALKNDGTLWAWGINTPYGQLGDGTTNMRRTPVPVPGLSGITAVAAGGYHTVALQGDGTLWAWGNNNSGQLGDGTTINRLTPVPVPGLSGITAIAAGGGHTLALKNDGTLWVWGNNGGGQLGDGTTSNRLTPVQVPNLSGITAIAAGGGLTLALQSDGTLWAWGIISISSPLGDSTITRQLTPVPVAGLSGITAVVAGGHHALALQSDGTLWAWGSNGWGQLGDGTTTNRLTPVPVANLSGITVVAAGVDYTLAQKSDGTLWAWGYNGWGQLGDGTTSWRSTPVPVPGLSGITAMAAGALHTLALKSDGTLWAWGNNWYGQLGFDPGWVPRQSLINLYVHAVTTTAGTGGSLSPAAARMVNGAETASFTVTPDSGYQIDKVTGCGGSLNGSVYTTGPITADCTVTASFTPITYTLGVTVSGSGTVHTSPGPDMACSGCCGQGYAPGGTIVTLTATPAAGNAFTGWSGACTGTGSCQLTMDAARSVTATFSPRCATPASITITASSSTGNYTVSWAAVNIPGVTYAVQEATNSTFTADVRYAYTGTATSVAITGRSSGKTYYYRVKAKAVGYLDSVNRTGGSGCVVTIRCATPASIAIPASSSTGNYTVSWAAVNIPGVTYSVQEATNSTFTADVRYAYTGTATSVAITGRSSGKIYYYRVKAKATGYLDSVNRTGGGGCVVTLRAAVPSTITVPATSSSGNYTLSWAAVNTPGVYYSVQEATDPSFITNVRYAYIGSEPSAAITGRTPGLTYYYRVKAKAAGYLDSNNRTGTNGCLIGGG